MLVDTSAWIEFFRASGSPHDSFLSRLMEQGEDVTVTEPIVMEVLAGARSEQDARRLRQAILAFRLLPLIGLADFEAAAAIHRACRQGGQTVRSRVDCLIAAVAIRHGEPVVHFDSDFDVIARHTDLRIEPIP